MSPEQSLTAVLLAAVAAPGFWDLLKTIFDKIHEQITGRKKATLDQIAEKMDAHQKDIDSLKRSFDQLEGVEQKKEVVNARRRMLRFNDELLRKQDHSKEYFDDILNDVKTYQTYCTDHPDFPNGKADMAAKNIKRCYELCMEKNSFLK